jgi:hypothetical protein
MIVNQKLIDSTHITEQRTNKETANLDKQYLMNPIRVKSILNNVNQIQKLSNALISSENNLAKLNHISIIQ